MQKVVFPYGNVYFFFIKKKFDFSHSELRVSISRLQTCVHFFEKGAFFRQNQGFSGKFWTKKSKNGTETPSFFKFRQKIFMIPFFDEKNAKKTFNKKQTITAGKSLPL